MAYLGRYKLITRKCVKLEPAVKNASSSVSACSRSCVPLKYAKPHLPPILSPFFPVLVPALYSASTVRVRVLSVLA